MQNTHTHSQYICINMEPRSVHPHTHNIYKHATLCCTHKHTIHIETRNLVLYTNTHTLYRNTEPRVAYPCGRDPDDESVYTYLQHIFFSGFTMCAYVSVCVCMCLFHFASLARVRCTFNIITTKNIRKYIHVCILK